jgi:hypothetical protein
LQVVIDVCNCLKQQKAGAMQGKKSFFVEGHATTFMGGVSSDLQLVMIFSNDTENQLE